MSQMAAERMKSRSYRVILANIATNVKEIL